MDFKRHVRLGDFLPEHMIYRQEFDYGDVHGFAEMYGWQFIFFSEDSSMTTIAAVSIADVFESKERLELARKIINRIGIGLAFGCDKDMVMSRYGKPAFICNILQGIDDYIYTMGDTLMTFSIDANLGFSGIEIVQNATITEGRMSCLKAL